jgi:hypothetical protein
VVNPLTVNEWLLRKIILQEENLSELVIIVKILDLDGKLDIGLVKLGKKFKSPNIGDFLFLSVFFQLLTIYLRWK